jgi:transposase
MVRRVRSGESMRSVARQLNVDVSTVSFWVSRAGRGRLDRVDFDDQKAGRAWNRTSAQIEQRIAQLRHALRDGDLGEFGARAIGTVLRAEMAHAPGEATINRVLARLGLQDGVRRIRRPAPPKGWYLPPVCARRAELDCFDYIEGLKIAAGPIVDVFTAKSLHGALTDAWVVPGKSTRATIPALLQRWQRDGLPAYAQFDNDTVFQGAHHHLNTVGAVSRLCLQLGVIPVFVPALEHGMQNSIESFNGLWQAKVWQRYTVANEGELQMRSDRYIAAHRARSPARSEHVRRMFPKRFRFNPQAPLRGRLIYLRRTNDRGFVYLLGRQWPVSALWLHRLVRCEVNFDHRRIDCYALRRAAPAEQPLLTTLPYEPPTKRFQGEL